MLGNARLLKFVRGADEVILNRQSLAANFEIAKREGARGYSAAAFLYKRYRRTIERLAGREYKNGQLKGVSSVEACVMHRHIKIVVPNKVGNALGNIEADVSGRECWFKISAFTSNVDGARFKGIVSKVESAVAADIYAYLDRKFKNL